VRRVQEGRRRGPLLERSHAAEAGLGFESKAANLLHPRFGPWFFLGELILDVELEPTQEDRARLVRHLHGLHRCLPDGRHPRSRSGRRAPLHQLPDHRGSRAGGPRAARGGRVLGLRLRHLLGGLPLDAAGFPISPRAGVCTPSSSAGTLVEWVEAPQAVFASLCGLALAACRREGLVRQRDHRAPETGRPRPVGAP
jgi:hypothetical protein